MFEGARDRRKTHATRLFTGVLIVAMLYFGREVFIPLALAGLVAFLLTPVATRLERLGLGRKLSALLVIGLSLAGVCTLCWVVLGQIYNLAIELPQYQQNVTQKIDSLHLHQTGKLATTIKMLTDVSKHISTGETEKPLERIAPPLSTRRSRSAQGQQPAANADLSKKSGEPIAVRVEEPDSSMFSMASRNLEPLIHPLTTTFVVVIFVIFMLLARDDIRDRAVRLAGSSRIHITTVAMSDAGDRVSRYLLMQFIVNLGYGSLIALGLWGIGVPHPLLWGFTTFLLRFIPYVGILAAGMGPLLVAVAVSPDWKQVAWTFGLYFVVEVISANAVEPFLYGSSTGVSALAILIAAIFWTWLWGIAGLLLSTPLTVCLIVLGRHVPTLAFVGVLFGEENVLAPSQRLYQRILAGDATDSNRLVEEQIHSKSRQEVYDGVLIPALSLVEAARHSEEINSIRAEQALQSFEDLVEEQWGRDSAAISAPEPVQRMVCVPARDFADEIACQLLTHVATASHRSQVLGADLQSADAIQAVTDFGANVVCIVGIPPQAVRHVRLRCHQIRARFPEMTIIACVLSGECDLPSIRSRIPLEDAQHVACSLLQATAYLAAMANPTPAVVLEENAAKPPEPEEAEQAVVEAIDERKQLELLDETEDDIFDRIASNLARSFEAPIALLSVRDANGKVWSAQCGLPGDDVGPQLHDLTICNEPNAQQVCVVIADTADDERFSHDPFLQEKGIRFLAGAPVMADDGREIGSLCVMDTRPRQITEQQRAVLVSLAEAVTNAVELRSGAAAEQVQ